MKRSIFIIVFSFFFTFFCEAQTTYYYDFVYSNKLAFYGDVINEYSAKGFNVKHASFYKNAPDDYFNIIYSDDDNEKKSYVLIYEKRDDWYLSGNIPSRLKNKYHNEFDDNSYLLNELSKDGYDLIFFESVAYDKIFLFSKKNSGGYNSVRSVNKDNKDVKEMARYNLEGMPVDSSHKGLQIIVFSDYTTKVVDVK